MSTTIYVPWDSKHGVLPALGFYVYTDVDTPSCRTGDTDAWTRPRTISRSNADAESHGDRRDEVGLGLGIGIGIRIDDRAIDGHTRADGVKVEITLGFPLGFGRGTQVEVQIEV